MSTLFPRVAYSAVSQSFTHISQETMPESSSSQTFTLSRIMEDPKEVLFMWIISINVYYIRN